MCGILTPSTSYSTGKYFTSKLGAINILAESNCINNWLVSFRFSTSKAHLPEREALPCTRQFAIYLFCFAFFLYLICGEENVWEREKTSKVNTLFCLQTLCKLPGELFFGCWICGQRGRERESFLKWKILVSPAHSRALLRVMIISYQRIDKVRRSHKIIIIVQCERQQDSRETLNDKMWSVFKGKCVVKPVFSQASESFARPRFLPFALRNAQFFLENS